jgi:hypothetical protein
MSIDSEAVVPCGADRACSRLETELGVVLTDRRRQGRTTIAQMHRAPGRRLDHIYPTFDAALAVTAIDDTTCLLTVTGSYEPPFGRLGAVLDRTVMHGLGATTAAGFARRLGHALAYGAKEGSP